MDADSWTVRLSRILLSAALIAGCAIGLYLAWHHDNLRFGDATARLANCPETETINCDVVNASPWSEVFGVPIAAWAVPTYLFTLGLLWAGRFRPRLLAYVFCIGLAATALSAFLFYVSKTQVGFLCLWCLRLYLVNLSILVLGAVAARRSPRALVTDTLRDLRAWPSEMRRAAAGFAVLLAATAAVQVGYRDALVRKSAREMQRIMDEGGPTVPAVPQGTGEGADASTSPGARRIDPQPASFVLAALGAPPAAPAAAGSAPAGAPTTFAGPLRRIAGERGGVKTEPFDLQSRLGKGRPVALIFWAPGFGHSERALVEWAGFLKQEAPQYDVYAVCGRRDDQRDEEIWEAFSMTSAPAGLPLLIDDGFKVSKALEVTDVPNLALFDRKGMLVIAKIKDFRQEVIGASGNLEAGALVRQVAAGQNVPTVQRMFPWYPATALYGHCAPAFTLNKFGTDESFPFSGRNPHGRPTLLVFWSSTCKHCQVEIPQLVAWVKDHPGQFDVVSVTQIRPDRPGMASHRKVTEAYIRSHGIGWPVLEDPDGAVNELYGVISTPTSVFVAADGTIATAWFYAHEQGFGEALTKELARTAPAPAGASCRPVSEPVASRLDFSVVGPGGAAARVPLASVLDRPALVHFWATWCVPCMKELPSLMRFRDRLEKSGEGKVVLVSVEDEGAADTIAKFQKGLGLDLRSYRAPRGGLADRIDLAYRVPRTFLVSPGGGLLGVRVGEQDWDDATVAERVRSRLRNSGAPPAITASRR